MDRESDRGSSEAGSGRGTPRSLGTDTPRTRTPGIMPTHMYSEEELYELEKAPASRIIPDCLEKDFIVDGIWDPERWVRSFGGGEGSAGGSHGGSRGPSPLAMDNPRERRPAENIFRRNSGSGMSADPKERLKEEKDGIVLSPQRRSFGTGCQPLLQRALSNMEADRDRRDQRRIGSGRIQIERERGGRDRSDNDYRSERERPHEKDSRDFRNLRDLDHNRDYNRDRDFHGTRDSRDRYDREDLGRDRDVRDARDRRFDRGERVFTRRDMGEKVGDNHRHRDRDFRDFRSHRHRQDSHKEEEPEWFSSGPISKSDTIELHGFERERRDSDRRLSESESSKRRVTPSRGQQKEAHDLDPGVVSEEEDKENEGISVADRNGSLETNESSSPENNTSDHEHRPVKSPAPHAPSFDINNFFDNFPTIVSEVPETEPSNLRGSRFFQQYRTSGANQSGGGSKENSRRSSINDEFGYLNELLNGSRSPVIPSPPPPSANSLYGQTFLSSFASSDKQHNIEFGTIGPKFGAALNNNTLVTALINNATVMERNRASPTGIKNSPQDTEAKLKALLFGRLDSTSSSGNTTPGFNSPMTVPGKVKTVAELEDELQKSHQKTGGGSGGGGGSGRVGTPPNLAHLQQHRRQSPVQHRQSPGQHRQSPQDGASDLTAFNKLISLMQQGAARPVESPKLPMKAEVRPQSPGLSGIPPHLHPTHLHQATPPGQLAANQNLPGQLSANQNPPGVSATQLSANQMHGLANQQAAQGRMGQKPEPLNIHAAHMLQNQRGSMDEIQFDMLDSYHGNMTTPPSGAPPTKFIEALQRNKEQQMQIQQAALQHMHVRQQLPTPGQPQVIAPSQQQQHTPGQPAQTQGGRRSSTGDPIMSFLKANPTIITKPASPTPPPQGTPTITGGIPGQPGGIPGSQAIGVTHGVGVPVMNLVQQIQPGSSPRGPSPSPVLQGALLSRQGQGTPRVPSPIMFSQQPPMHLSAPSPIHPASQSGSSLPQSPVGQPGSSTSANSIRPPTVPRVPSPQELIVHTQAILQNALIKKQLEDQKERFLKKQQERGKSPNPQIMALPVQMSGSTPQPVNPLPQPMASTPAKSTPVNVAFTPTSVIRKMHSEKASEKEKQRRDSMDMESLETRDQGEEGEQGGGVDSLNSSSSSRHDQPHPVHGHHLQQHLSAPSSATSIHPSLASMGVTSGVPVSSLQMTGNVAVPPTSIPPPAVLHAVPPPPLPNQVLPNMVSVLPPGTATVLPGLPPLNTLNPLTNQLKHLPPPPPTLVSTHLPPPLLSPGAAQLAPPHGGGHTALVTQEQIEALKTQQMRALIGQQQSPSSPCTGVPIVSSAIPSSGRPIVKGPSTPVSHGPDLAALLHRSLATSTPHGAPRVLANSTHSGTPTTPYGMPLTGRLPVQSTPILGAQPANSGGNPLLVQQMVQASNPRGYHPQMGGPRMFDPRALRGQLPGGVVPVSLQAGQPFNPHPLSQMNTHKNGPVSPGHIPVSMVNVSASNKPDSVNLMKWFGTDMLKTSLPTMPPLPVQGQRVLTLDEIERL